MAQNMYRVGDYVYFEISSAAPYQIRKIEELSKNAAGQVEAKVMCFYRRREISSALLKISDQAERKFTEFFEVSSMPDGYVHSGHVVASINGKKEDENGVKIENGENGSCEKEKEEDTPTGDWGLGGLPIGAEKLNDAGRHKLRLRELFVSRNMETLPATHIRGKCSVTLLNEVETIDSYERPDAFFYSLMFDPGQSTLLADKGAIRVGDKYQCVVPEKEEERKEEGEEEKIKETKKEEDDEDENGVLMIDEEEDKKDDKEDGEGEDGDEKRNDYGNRDEREVLVYHPHHSLTDRDIDQFLIVARAVGTFSRALDTSSSSKLPSLHMTAAAASRDVTLFHAMALLHQANYDIGQAVKFLVPPPSKQHYPLDADKCTSHKTVSLGGPILCRDQMEEWSAAEANLFEDAVEKYGKDFNDVRNDFLPWKSIRDIVEYYYMWKTTNRYVDVKKAKNQELDKLKQVYIPNYNKPNANLVGPPNTTGQLVPAVIPCESCATTLSLQWYAWGPPTLQLRLCTECWTHWKKMGGLKKSNEHERHDLEGANDLLSGAQQQNKLLNHITVNPLAINRATQQRVIPPIPVTNKQGMKNIQNAKQRVSFIMQSDPLSKMARRLSIKNAHHPSGILNMRQLARKPFTTIDHSAVKGHCQSIDQSSQLKCAMGVFKVANAMALPQPLIQAISTQCLFTGKRQAGSNGSELGAPPAKRAPPTVA
ncbi:lin-40 [Pristionchus pacificus]|nr:lin-40 [Pristionchus pacificus]